VALATVKAITKYDESMCIGVTMNRYSTPWEIQQKARFRKQINVTLSDGKLTVGRTCVRYADIRHKKLRHILHMDSCILAC